MRLWALGIAALAALVGLVAVHACWIVQGPRDPRFVRFMRRYNHRANADDVIPEHGASIDMHGRPFAMAASGSTFEKVLDELQLASGKPVPLTIDADLQSKAV